MKRNTWVGVLAMLVLGVGCGGRPRPLEAFKDRKFRIDFGRGSLTTSAPAGHYLLSFWLPESGTSSCTSLESDVVATVNDDPNVDLSPGGCVPTAASSPMFTYEVEPGQTAPDATIVVSDSTHRMEVRVENLFAAYRLQPRDPEFDPSLSFEEGANPVTRGEILTFDRVPNLRAAASFEASMSQERQVGQQYERNYFEVHPTLDDAEMKVTMPTEIEDGMATLKVTVTENPVVLGCAGVASCEAEVHYGIESTVTIKP
jgi:hypothetical protein